MRFRLTSKVLIALLTMLFAGALVACGSDDDEAEDEDSSNPTETAGAAYKPTGNEGSITGTIAFTGTAPAAKSISMDADPRLFFCQPECAG